MAKKHDPKDPNAERYLVVNVVSRRARDLNRRRTLSLYDDDAPDPLDVALNEYDNGLLNYEFRNHLIGTGEDYRSR